MLRLSREEHQLILPHFISFPIIFQSAAHMHKEPDVLSLTSSSELQECSLAQQRRNLCGLPSARLGTAVHLGIFLAWRFSGSTASACKRTKLSLECVVLGTHNHPDPEKPLEPKSCGPAGVLAGFRPLVSTYLIRWQIPCLGFRLSKTILL